MARLLIDTQREWMDESFVWGKTDCGLSILNYVCRAVGARPEAWPHHTDQRSAAELLEDAGGLVEYASSIAEVLNLEETPLPARGDVGVVDVPAMGLTCGIFMGDKWMLRGEKSVLLYRATPVKCWRVPCHKQ